MVAKPIVGVLDAVTHTSEGFRDLAQVISMDKRGQVRRHRLQHTFANDGRLLPYNAKVCAYMLEMYRDQAPVLSCVRIQHVYVSQSVFNWYPCLMCCTSVCSYCSSHAR